MKSNLRRLVSFGNMCSVFSHSFLVTWQLSWSWPVFTNSKNTDVVNEQSLGYFTVFNLKEK